MGLPLFKTPKENTEEDEIAIPQQPDTNNPSHRRRIQIIQAQIEQYRQEIYASGRNESGLLAYRWNEERRRRPEAEMDPRMDFSTQELRHLHSTRGRPQQRMTASRPDSGITREADRRVPRLWRPAQPREAEGRSRTWDTERGIPRRPRQPGSMAEGGTPDNRRGLGGESQTDSSATAAYPSVPSSGTVSIESGAVSYVSPYPPMHPASNSRPIPTPDHVDQTYLPTPSAAPSPPVVFIQFAPESTNTH